MESDGLQDAALEGSFGDDDGEEVQRAGEGESGAGGEGEAAPPPSQQDQTQELATARDCWSYNAEPLSKEELEDALSKIWKMPASELKQRPKPKVPNLSKHGEAWEGMGGSAIVTLSPLLSPLSPFKTHQQPSYVRSNATSTLSSTTLRA